MSEGGKDPYLDEIEKYRGLLALLDGLRSARPGAAEAPGAGDHAGDREGGMLEAFGLGANDAVLRHARARACKNGLAAVARYIAVRSSA